MGEKVIYTYIFVLAVVVNLVLFIIHKVFYKTLRDDFRRNWIRATIAFGIGVGFTHILRLICGMASDHSILWIALGIVVSGLLMIFINRSVHKKT